MSGAKDVLNRMRQAAGSARPISTAEDSVAPLEERVVEDVIAPIPVTLPIKRKRFSLDLDAAQHLFLKRLAVESGVDAAQLLRGALRLLEADPALRDAVVLEAQEQ